MFDLFLGDLLETRHEISFRHEKNMLTLLFIAGEMK